MPLALATLGLPGLPLPEALRLAADHGWDGLELRCAAGEAVHPAMDASERRSAVREFTAAGVVPLTLASYVGLAAPGPDEPVLTALRARLRLAADLGTRYLRVFPHGGDGPAAEADRRGARRLAAVAGQAQELGLRVLLETHDSHRSGADVARLLAAADHPAAGALWDLMHTRLAGETPAASYAALGPRLGYLQVKDIAGAEDRTPLPLGAGVLPIAEAVAALPPDSWVAWEYEAPWHPAARPLPPLLGDGARLLAGMLAAAAGGHDGPGGSHVPGGAGGVSGGHDTFDR
ncbi:sugar phosphate isomerase/epimerase family protein [Kitasatospora herbaricolor]|uniref:Sugar phosphate isomerase/epimerase n=1 Tax=Kitasatospora herbaricolor TaxID=68217 RepID=A0ABZ1W3K0_9ACTN|nr:TIM barrel protein [Kitasatospora herbaricolor]